MFNLMRVNETIKIGKSQFLLLQRSHPIHFLIIRELI